MPSVNKVILIGHCGGDPEMRYAPSGDAIANVSIATTEKRKGGNGETLENTEWHRIVFFGRLAEVVRQYVKKGDAIYIEGKIRTRKWTDQKGIERYTTEILANQLQMLGNKNDGQPQSSPQDYAAASGRGRRNTENFSGQYRQDRDRTQ